MTNSKKFENELKWNEQHRNKCTQLLKKKIKNIPLSARDGWPKAKSYDV